MARAKKHHTITLPSGVLATYRVAGVYEFMILVGRIQADSKRGTPAAELDMIRNLLVSVDGATVSMADLAGGAIDEFLDPDDAQILLESIVTAHSGTDEAKEAAKGSLVVTVG